MSCISDSLQRIVALTLNVVQLLLVSGMVSWNTIGSLPVTVVVILVLRGWDVAKEEVRGIAWDFYRCGYYVISGGSWTTVDAKRNWRFLLSGAQFSCVISSYVVNYGIISHTIVTPTLACYRIYQAFDATDPVFCSELRSAVPRIAMAGISYCIMANTTSHRYFAHRSYQTSRPFQAVLAAIAGMSGQRGALWWSSHHREHHKHCGEKHDPHTPAHWGMHYAHIGWILDRAHFEIKEDVVRDWYEKAPELLVIEIISIIMSHLGTSAVSLVVGEPVAILGQYCSLHFEGLINSYCHSGNEDESDPCAAFDSLLVALLAGGEGFHRYHHVDPCCAKHSAAWNRFAGLLDTSYISICLLECFGLVWGVRRPKNRDL